MGETFQKKLPKTQRGGEWVTETGKKKSKKKTRTIGPARDSSTAIQFSKRPLASLPKKGKSERKKRHMGEKKKGPRGGASQLKNHVQKEI